jgi:hypothetical protein
VVVPRDIKWKLVKFVESFRHNIRETSKQYSDTIWTIWCRNYEQTLVLLKPFGSSKSQQPAINPTNHNRHDRLNNLLYSDYLGRVPKQTTIALRQICLQIFCLVRFRKLVLMGFSEYQWKREKLLNLRKNWHKSKSTCLWKGNLCLNIPCCVQELHTGYGPRQVSSLTVAKTQTHALILSYCEGNEVGTV